MKIEISDALQRLFYEYTHLPIGGKEIVCPYWMNNLKKGIYGPLGGKGRPREIVNATYACAKTENVDLSALNKEEIILFMQSKRIGIDCSGFVFWMLDSLDLEKGGDGIAGDIPGSDGAVIKARANVQMLTGESVSYLINSVCEMQVGDMIRIYRGKHVAIIVAIGRSSDKKIEFFDYAHSSSPAHAKISGVHKARINILNEKEGLLVQDWEGLSPNGNSYKKNIYLESGDGVRRLNIWK